MNSEQRKLCVQSTIEIDARFLRKQSIGCNGPNKLMMKLSKRLCLVYLCDIFRFIIQVSIMAFS